MAFGFGIRKQQQIWITYMLWFQGVGIRDKVSFRVCSFTAANWKQIRRNATSFSKVRELRLQLNADCRVNPTVNNKPWVERTCQCATVVLILCRGQTINLPKTCPTYPFSCRSAQSVQASESYLLSKARTPLACCTIVGILPPPPPSPPPGMGITYLRGRGGLVWGKGFGLREGWDASLGLCGNWNPHVCF